MLVSPLDEFLIILNDINYLNYKLPQSVEDRTAAKRALLGSILCSIINKSKLMFAENNNQD